MKHDRSITNPGMHKQFQINRFNHREKSILERLSKEWYLTSSGSKIRLAASEYNYFLMKPTRIFSEMFNIERELIVVFSSYESFEPRSLDAFDAAQKELTELRVESVCRILISNDSEVERKVKDLLKTDPEQPVVIPFTYNELSSPYDNYFLRNKFRNHFYTRDLFGFLSPLKKDLYFFGRSELLQEIINKHRSGEHTGLFGLRKSGKTSIIYAIERHLNTYGGVFVSIDCESPSVHKLRWFELLEKLVKEYKIAIKSKYKINSQERYNEKNAADSFSEDILGIYNSKKNQPLLLLFDEIERISPKTGSSTCWRTGEDFIFFWQTLRAFYQRNQGVFTYMLLGTNPNCVELPFIAGHENPLFSSIPSQYVPCFTVEQTREMVRKLGRYMGLKFEEFLFGKLVEDFGGHPFLIRQFCSQIHESSNSDRPINVDRALYNKVIEKFKPTIASYLEMIINVLQEFYPDEFDMLRFLAQGDYDTFKNFAAENIRYTKHLIGYGLISQSEHGYTFNIESLRGYLNSIFEHERINLNSEEKLAEISSRRNRLEKNLRKTIKFSLKTKYGRKKAEERIISSIPKNRRESLSKRNIEFLLSKNDSPLYFLDLKSIISREWDSCMSNIFEMEKNKLDVMLSEINEFGRVDAHAKDITKDDFDLLRLHFNKLEKILSEWI